MIISATGHNVRNALAEARRVARLKLKDTRVLVDSAEEGGLHRVTLNGGCIVEVTVVKNSASAAHIVSGDSA